jgi:hypothetical protein
LSDQLDRDESISGIALATLSLRPLNGLRHPPTETTSGWYIWGGEFKNDPDFFQPNCTYHVIDQFPELSDLLALPPGSRWLWDGSYVDQWFDESLLLAQ